MCFLISQIFYIIYFSYPTDCLIDHDVAINELMWQNAGLVGVDPFYHGIKWEAAPSSKSVDNMPTEINYVDKWMEKQLVWPSHLEQYAKRQPLTNIVEMAGSRRDALRAKGIYKAARTISNSGVRVAWPGLKQNESFEAGEVMAIGMKPVNELSL